MTILTYLCICIALAGFAGYLWQCTKAKVSETDADIIETNLGNTLYWIAWVGSVAALFFAIRATISIPLLLLYAMAAGLVAWIVGWKLNQARINSKGKWLFIQVAVLFCFRSFAWESYQIPSSSMYPGLQVGDYVIVNRHAFDFKVPELGVHLWEVSRPEIGDVIVFSSPESGIPLVKRVIAKAGDTVRVSGKRVYINGKLLSWKLLEADGDIQQVQETNRGKTYQIQIYPNRQLRHGSGVWSIREGEYFVLGDNRDNSRDSRYYGKVSEDLLLGQADYIWMHWPSFTSVPHLDHNRVLGANDIQPSQQP